MIIDVKKNTKCLFQSYKKKNIIFVIRKTKIELKISFTTKKTYRKIAGKRTKVWSYQKDKRKNNDLHNTMEN